MIELYHSDMSVCAAKVRIVLAEKGVAWQGHHLNLGAGDAQRPDYLKLNPNGVVPTIVDDGKVLIESTVICEYLDDKWPAPPLKPTDAAARARMRLWAKQLDEGLHATTGTGTYCAAFRKRFEKMAPAELDAFLAKIPTEERRTRIGQAIRMGMDAPGFQAGIQRFAKMIRDMDASLAGTRWLAANDYSLADVAYTPYMTRLEHLGLDGMFKKYPRVADWAERLKARQSYAKGMHEWFNPSTLDLFAGIRDATRAKVAAWL